MIRRFLSWVLRLLGRSSGAPANPRARASASARIRTADPGVFGGGSAPVDLPPYPGLDGPGERPTPAPGPAPPPSRAARLRRAAAIDIFDRLGLLTVPGQLWAFIDARNDLASGIAAFFRALGLDVEAIRRADPDEIERANDVFDLLASVGPAFDRLSPSAVAVLQRLVFAGGYDEVRAALLAVDACERIVRLAERYPSDGRPASFNAFLRAVQAELDDPAALEPDDVRELEEGGAAYARLLSEHRFELDRHAALTAELNRIWPDPWRGGPEQDGLAATLSRFDDAGDRLRDEAGLEVPAAEALVAEMRAANDAIQAQAARAEAASRGTHSSGGSSRAGAGSGHAPPPPPPPRSARDQALLFFGFAPGSAPDATAVRHAWRTYIKANHPDGCPPGELEERTRRTAEANGHYDQLKSTI